MSDPDQEAAYAAVRAKFPRGKVCPQCGHLMDVSKFRIIGKIVPNKTPRLCPYCFECDKQRTAHKNDQRSRAKAGIPRARPTEHLDNRKPLPVLKVGERYRIIDRGKSWEGFEACNGRQKVKVYDGVPIKEMNDGKRPIRWAFKYKLGNSGMEKVTCFNQGQLIFHTIIPIREAH